MDQKLILTKAETRTLMGLSMQRQEILKALDEVAEAERDLIDMIAARRKLPEGEYVVIQDGGGELFLQKREEKKEEKAPAKEGK